jgi:molecular chaperone Hsp33
MDDTLERVIATSGGFFGVACRTTNLVEEACRRHDAGPTAAAALGRVLTGAVLLASLLKDKQSVLLRFEGNGPLRKVIAEAGYDGWVRGSIANPHAEVPLNNGRIDVAAGIGRAGFLTVTKTIAENQRYPGTIQLTSSEVGDDIAHYLAHSEQTQAAIGLTVHLEKDGRVAAAGGFLVQSLPPPDETLLTRLEQAIAQLPPLSTLLLAGTSPAEILSRLFQGVPHRWTAARPLRYACSCSRQKMAAALLTLGSAELDDLIASEGGAEARCEFCRQGYSFSASELAVLRRKAAAATAPLPGEKQ